MLRFAKVLKSSLVPVTAQVFDGAPLKVSDAVGMDELSRLNLELFVMLSTLLLFPRVDIDHFL